VDTNAAIALLFTPAGRDDPYPLYDVLREAAPVLVAGDGFAVVTGYEAAQQALRDPRFQVEDIAYFDRAFPGWQEHSALRTFAHSLLNLNEPDHGRVRRLAAHVFTARRVADLRPAVETATAALLDRLADHLADGGTAEFMAEFAYQLPVSVICDLLGVPESDRDWFRPRAIDLTATLEMSLDLDALSAANRADAELDAYFRDLVRSRRRDPHDDLVSALATADGLTDVELIANLVLLLVAGFETTTNLLGNGLQILLERPDQAAALRDDPSRAAGYVEEFLRFDSPVQLTSRRLAAEPVTLGGIELPRGGSALLLVGAANRDPARFTDPETFQPTRDNAPLSFGAGAHYCLGAALARLEAQVAFPALLQRFPRLEPAAAPARRDRLTLRGYAALPVRTG